MTTAERASAIMGTLREPLAKLRAAGHVAVPSDSVVEEALGACLGRNGWRKSKPAGDGPGAVLWQMVRWHRSGGSLHGWPWFADKQVVDEMDTVAQVLLLLSRTPMTAVNAWQRAMHG